MDRFTDGCILGQIIGSQSWVVVMCVLDHDKTG